MGGIVREIVLLVPEVVVMDRPRARAEEGEALRTVWNENLQDGNVDASYERSSGDMRIVARCRDEHQQPGNPIMFSTNLNDRFREEAFPPPVTAAARTLETTPPTGDCHGSEDDVGRGRRSPCLRDHTVSQHYNDAAC